MPPTLTLTQAPTTISSDVTTATDTRQTKAMVAFQEAVVEHDDDDELPTPTPTQNTTETGSSQRGLKPQAEPTAVDRRRWCRIGEEGGRRQHQHHVQWRR